MTQRIDRPRLPSGPKCLHRGKIRSKPISITLNAEGHAALERMRTVQFPGISAMDAVNEALVAYFKVPGRRKPRED